MRLGPQINRALLGEVFLGPVAGLAAATGQFGLDLLRWKVHPETEDPREARMILFCPRTVAATREILLESGRLVILRIGGMPCAHRSRLNFIAILCVKP